MKIVAIVLVCTLIGVMGWLLFESNSKARGLSNKLEMLTRAHGNDAAAPGGQPPSVAEQDLIAGKEQELLNQMSRNQGSPGAIPPPVGRPAGSYSAPAGSPVGSLPGAMSLPPGMNPADIAPPPMSPRQRMISAAPTLAKVTEYQKEFGFVVINAGSKRKLEKDMIFSIRRGGAIIGRIKVTEVSDEGSVADLPVDTVPVGVTIEVGDEVIQDMPPEA
ncbi:hypothetical protein [Roseimicrobium sp. ORNL1]|uniref:hypothetical protein n=1 Tax=Roseimicrobium sp. ORNL1 TaxID=2711231 RepID=UPI0013E15665|nr:hypothetical protein [Roseimicrobium sp. ORNL1]QIF04443.1 hypothetical protein G5S37_23925 [Roseimicrobium sp. ORNL1]